MRRFMLMMGILGIFASVAGCKKAPVDDTSALENPPPKPPKCPDLPELKNITLEDGTIADVRIVQVLDTKLYIPTSWTGPFVDNEIRGLGGFYNRSTLQTFQPNMHSVECPGVVHSFEGKEIPSFGLRFKNFARKEPNNGISDDSKMEGVSILKHHPDAIDRFGPSNGGAGTATMVISDDIYIMFTYPNNSIVGSPKWGRDKNDIQDLFAWLATPPAKRDNGRIFKLGVEGQ